MKMTCQRYSESSNTSYNLLLLHNAPLVQAKPACHTPILIFLKPHQHVHEFRTLTIPAWMEAIGRLWCCCTVTDPYC